MVRIFRITMTTSFSGKFWLYQSKASFDKQWLVKTGPKHYIGGRTGRKVELVAEEVINGQWVEIDRWDNGVP